MIGPGNLTEPDYVTHVLDDKLVDVVDLVCPDCGNKLFVYYRVVPAKDA
jgi:hypothetical protein